MLALKLCLNNKIKFKHNKMAYAFASSDYFQNICNDPAMFVHGAVALLENY